MEDSKLLAENLTIYHERHHVELALTGYCSAKTTNIYLLDPVYDLDTLYDLRARASLDVHGHSAGGSNLSLVAMVYFKVPILAHGCAFNRHTTENKSRYFETGDELVDAIQAVIEDWKQGIER